MNCPCETCSALNELRADVRRILELLLPKKCTEKDLDQLARLLPAIGGKFGDSAVTTREILQDVSIRNLFPGNSGSLGSLLSRAAEDGAQADGYCLERRGKEHSATLWGVSKVPKSIAARARR